VLKVTTKKYSLLLTGDIEKNAENYLIQHHAQALHATVLVAPHHGSDTSSTATFIQNVDPRIVLFPVGYLNRYHFPKAHVIERYRAHRVIMRDTVNCGAILISLLDDSLRVGCFRKYRKS
jgi:competence protein ComEC